MTTTEAAFRPSLPIAYQRDATLPLRIAGSGGVRARRALNVWRDYVGLRQEQGQPHLDATPLATTWLTAIEAMLLDRREREPLFPGSFYPAGFRAQVLAASGLRVDPLVDEPDAESTELRRAILHCLADPATAPADTLVLVATALNLLTMYPAVVRHLHSEARIRGDRALFAQVVRAAYSGGGDEDAATRVLVSIATSDEWEPLSRLSTCIGLIAHFNRRSKDPRLSQQWADRATSLATEFDDGSFAWSLNLSHLARALALHFWIQGDAAATAEQLSFASNKARAIRVPGIAEAEDRAALHSERLVLEARLKTSLSPKVEADPRLVEEDAARIIEIDPADPYANLVAGDAYWLIDKTDASFRCLDTAIRGGTLAGATAAYHAACFAEQVGVDAERWQQASRDLDGESPWR